MKPKQVNEKKVCVIIVSYNFEPWIYKCLQSIENSTVEADILVIDNASNDKTCEIILTNFPNVKLIENKENLGFGKANNIGIRYAIDEGYSYVFLLNQDAWLDKDALEILVNEADQHPDYGIISPIHLTGDGENIDKGFGDYTKLSDKTKINELPSILNECVFINAAIWLLPIKAILETGGFAPLFAHYGEDRNYTQRIIKRGYKIGFVKTAIGYHDRHFREMSKEKFFNLEYVYFLTESVNPNYTFPSAFGYGVLAPIKKALKSILKGDLNAFKNYVLIFFKIIRRMRSIIQTRKTTSVSGSHFLY